jgi:hypothetical protein
MEPTVKSAVEATKPAAMETAAMETATAPHAAVTAHTAHALGHCGCGRNREDRGQKKRPSQTHLDLPPRVSAEIIRPNRANYP